MANGAESFLTLPNSALLPLNAAFAFGSQIFVKKVRYLSKEIFRC
jgi:hypothetical protein